MRIAGNFMKKSEVYDYLNQNPRTIQVAIAPYPYVIPALSAYGEKYVRSEANGTSRDNLLNNIAEFGEQDGFFDLCDEFNVHFGSFARKTKCRELDDIDLMIGIAANGATYNQYDPWDNVRITASTINLAQKNCIRDDGTLNSTKVTNRFKDKLESVREYSRSEVRRNGEAVVLNLKSKDWSFDIVPCFHTVTESDGRAYYLIPNGQGYWNKTDPQ